MTRDIDRDVIRENEPDHIAYISFSNYQGLFSLFFFPDHDRLSLYTFTRFTRSSRLPVVRDDECSVYDAGRCFR